MGAKYLQMAELAEFVEWLQAELDKRDWRQADLARRGGIHTGLLSRIMSLERNPGPDTCSSIAKALNIPPEDVFRKAGLLPSLPAEDAAVREITTMLREIQADTEGASHLNVIRDIVATFYRRVQVGQIVTRYAAAEPPQQRAFQQAAEAAAQEHARRVAAKSAPQSTPNVLTDEKPPYNTEEETP